MAFHPWPWMVHEGSIPAQAWSMDGPRMAIAWKPKVRKAQNSLQKLRFLNF